MALRAVSSWAPGRKRWIRTSLLWALAYSWPVGTAFAEQPPADITPPSIFDPAAPPKATIRLLPYLSFGGFIALDDLRWRHNLDLNDAQHDDRSTATPVLSIAFSLDPHPKVQVYLNLQLSGNIILADEPKVEESRLQLRVPWAVVYLRDVLEGLSFQIGRLGVFDDREWAFSAQLDTIRALYRISNFSFDLFVGQQNFFREDLLEPTEQKGPGIYALRAQYELARTKFQAYVLVRDDRSEEPEDPIFLGLHSDGELVDGLKHWLELAYVQGQHESNKVRGIGFDVGGNYSFRHRPMRPSLTLGYAFGSPDFQQTGLNENESNLIGVSRFPYYGVSLKPELSNLGISTVGVGIRPTRRSSIDLLYHHYHQVELTTEKLREARIRVAPTGKSNSLGSEIDLVVGYREIRNLDMQLALGYFIPHDGFPAGSDPAFFARFKVGFRF